MVVLYTYNITIKFTNHLFFRVRACVRVCSICVHPSAVQGKDAGESSYQRIVMTYLP